MPNARLLLRETSTACLTSLVAKALRLPPPHPEYTLRLDSDALELCEVCDEGFESDMESIGGGHECGRSSTINDSDSANGSTTSSDCESDAGRKVPNERHELSRCLCYALDQHDDILTFVMAASAVFVFRFERPADLRAFYANFSALKALANHKKASSGAANKYGLLQRTDRDGVTHIEITNDAPRFDERLERTAILVREQKPVILRQVWRSGSVDDLLQPKKPERRKKPPAPQPPVARIAADEPRAACEPKFPRFNVVKEPKKSLISLPAWTTLLRQKKEPVMAYRYIDATANAMTCRHGNATAMTDRLFGLSPRLRDFGFHGDGGHNKWQSAGDLTLKSDVAAGLKSVIKNSKAEEKKKKSKEKKVTFSAYTTVQVV